MASQMASQVQAMDNSAPVVRRQGEVWPTSGCPKVAQLRVGI
jgi:hypothetical protein